MKILPFYFQITLAKFSIKRYNIFANKEVNLHFYRKDGINHENNHYRKRLKSNRRNQRIC